MSKTDTSAEAIARHIDRCWLTDPEPDRTETLLRALAAERDALRAQLAEAEGALEAAFNEGIAAAESAVNIAAHLMSRHGTDLEVMVLQNASREIRTLKKGGDA